MGHTPPRTPARLKVSKPTDSSELEADRMAESVMGMTEAEAVDPSLTAGREGQTDGIRQACSRCDNQEVHRQADGEDEIDESPQASDEVSEEEEGAVPLKSRDTGRAAVDVRSARQVKLIRHVGQPLPTTLRSFFEPRFQHDFSRVRIHADAAASESATALNALAYTLAPDIVFGAGQYSPGTQAGLRLLAHELAHVVQQSGLEQRSGTSMTIQRSGSSSTGSSVGSSSAGSSSGSSGSSGGDECKAPFMPPPPGHRVCSRATALFGAFNHAYVEAAPFRYGLIKRCKPTSRLPDIGIGPFPTAALAVDRSPDPCCKSPVCVDCVPKPGITDLDACFASAFAAYNKPCEYKVLPGPNSNTFAGTLARACCDGMSPAPAALGSVPGWDHAPAAGIPATCTGPVTC